MQVKNSSGIGPKFFSKCGGETRMRPGNSTQERGGGKEKTHQESFLLNTQTNGYF